LKKLSLVVAILSSFLFSCGGGGGGSGNITISGKVVASSVKGLKVCIKDSNICNITDQDGNFNLESPTPFPTLNFYIDDVLLADYTLKENGESINPFKMAEGNETVGDILAKLIHAFGNDTDETEAVVDLTGVYISTPLTDSIEDYIKSGNTLEIDFFKDGNTHHIEISNSTVKLDDNPVSYRQWLVLIYMDGDNSLGSTRDNSYVSFDLSEMESVSFPLQVKVVALVDYYGNTGGEIYETDDTGKLKKVADINELNMGDQETLVNFVKEYMDKYPASKKALIFWDHGDGWRSVNYQTRFSAIDETDGDTLFMFEVRNALNYLKDNNYEINLIGFDECLMGMIEPLYDIKDFAEYFVASEALEPADGWNYERVFGKLSSNPSASPEEFGKMIVDSFKEEYESYNSDLTLTLFKSSDIDYIVNNLNQFVSYLNNTNYENFKSARENSVEVPDWEGGSYVDLYSFLNNFSYDSAVNIRLKIDSLYKFKKGNLNGISIYFPISESNIDECYYVAYPQTCEFNGGTINDYYNPFTDTEWDEFLKEYYTLTE
jgi:hypothetical protein